MTEARTLKQREYNTTITQHSDTRTVTRQDNQRDNNTFKSTALVYDADVRAVPKCNAVREKIFSERPVTAPVQRATYQDSNIFGYKDTINDSRYQETIQKSCKKPAKEITTRATNTFSSNVFGEAKNNGLQIRDQNTYQSSVFAGAQANKVSRKKLGGACSGTDNLFGSESKTFTQTSINTRIEAPKGDLTFKTVNETVTNSQQNNMTAKAKELYGATLQKHSLNDKTKKDGILMAQGADWRINSTKAFNGNSPLKETCKNLDAKDRKHQNMQSSVFGGGWQEYEPVLCDKNARKAVSGSDAGWASQSGLAKPLNGIGKQEAFRERQKQLASEVLPATDHFGHMPMGRSEMKSFKDNTVAAEAQNVNLNTGKKPNQGISCDVRRQEPSNQNYDPKQAARQVLYGKYQDAAQMEAPAKAPEIKHQAIPFQGKNQTKAQTQAMLASNHLTSAESSLNHYHSAKPTQVVDLEIKGLPENCQSSTLKAVSGSKHVIKATVEEDNFKGTCTGTGRIQMRLNQGENLDSVMMNFAKMGFSVQEFSQNLNKQPNLTGFTKEKSKEITDHKLQKQSFLQTQAPDMFGTSQRFDATRE